VNKDNIFKHIINFFKGLLVGGVNVVPGMSGGTILILCGIYEPILTNVNGMFKGKKQFLSSIIFLLPILLGALVGIYALSRYVIEPLINNFALPTFALFAGLVLGSVPLIVKMLYKPEIDSSVHNSQNDVRCEVGDESQADNVIASEAKQSSSTMLNAQCSMRNDGIDIKNTATMHDARCTMHEKAENRQPSTVNSNNIKFKPWHIIPAVLACGLIVGLSFFTAPETGVRQLNFGTALMLVLAGAIATGAMVLPGISGTFMLLLMGYYTTVINAVSTFNFLALLFFGVGAVAGLLLAAKGAKFLLKKFKTVSYLAIIGLLVGSVIGIFLYPDTYKSAADTAGIIVAVILFIAGCAATILLSKFSKSKTI
jgi:uncharacterized membrane protein